MNENPSIVDLSDYDAKGFVVITEAIDRSACEVAQEKIWALLEKNHGIRSTDPSTWQIADPRGLSELRQSGALQTTLTPKVMRAIAELFGERLWRRPSRWGGPLVTFPTAGPWQVPSKGWHIDYPARGNLGVRFGLKVLGLLKDMEPGGGATLVAPGSHRLVKQLASVSHGRDAGKSSEVRKKLLNRGVDFRQDYFEFTGRMGDVLLFDPWLFHAPSPNVRNTPRMMVEQNVPSVPALSLYAPRSDP